MVDVLVHFVLDKEIPQVWYYLNCLAGKNLPVGLGFKLRIARPVDNNIVLIEISGLNWYKGREVNLHLPSVVCFLEGIGVVDDKPVTVNLGSP